MPRASVLHTVRSAHTIVACRLLHHHAKPRTAVYEHVIGSKAQALGESREASRGDLAIRARATATDGRHGR
eukprot:6207635-Prymnesium_polylepis.1